MICEAFPTFCFTYHPNYKNKGDTKMKLTFKEPVVLVVEGVVIKITDNTTIEFEIEKQTAARPAITNEKNYVTNKVSLTDDMTAKKPRVKVRLIEKPTQRIYNFDSKYVASEFMGFHKTYINTMTRDNKFENERYQWYFLNNL
jgi:hypothetical protein